MARGPRWRRGAHAPGETSDDDVDLDAPEHAWWAQQDLHATPWRDEPEPDADQSAAPGTEPETAPEASAEMKPATEPEPESRDVLAEHFGADWRTSFGFDRPGPVVPPREPDRQPEPDPIIEPQTVDTSDPYAVLGIEPSASWEDIVDAHRAQARRHHPDHLFGRPEAEVAKAEERIRDINVAYQELRVRRGK
jgi:DnaJ-domain-containing protein 1